jgi:hypothetical protein
MLIVRSLSQCLFKLASIGSLKSWSPYKSDSFELVYDEKEKQLMHREEA